MGNIQRPNPHIQQIALFALMFLPGLSWSSWVSRTPAMRDLLQAPVESMGLMLFGFSCGSMAGILLAGKLINSFGIRRIMLWGYLLLSAGLLILAFSMAIPDIVLAFFALAVFGFGAGLSDITINIEASAFERQQNKPVMTILHGFFSGGTLAGAVTGMLMAALNLPPQWHFTLIAGLLLVCIFPLINRLDWQSEKEAAEQPQSGSYQSQVFNELRDKRLLLLGVVILAMALAEGSANDWVPLLMTDGYHFSHTTGTLVYVGFTAGMTLGRFIGGSFVRRFGRVRMLRFSALSAVSGLLLVIFSSVQWLAAVAVILWGIGASLGFPLTISAAGEGKNSNLRVTIAATLGYIAFLVGPPCLGFLGQYAGLRMAMLPVLLMVIIAFFCTSSAASPRQD
ncbi:MULTISPECIES: MFS transporter [Tatumella]|uniref:MFS transporter n=1 Tax=Tatumella punctata TaxID=399969 RepID=A0ABW1VNW9_9GAMM|nr:MULTISPECIES: MFS transporter [unclassified Tatumella]MBS0855789.1 MFS transporter [Tatumella sp. JGM16]MBS0895264.1 MFS transporter [Tatumella sp. JGM130]MBS0912697.1 MFS transporter [Tatumella sp. JGM91]